MNKVLTLMTVLFQLWTGSIHNTATIEGKVTDASNKEPLLFATVVLYKSGVLVKGIETDLDGNFILSDVTPDTYDMEASYVGYAAHRQTGIILKAGKNRVNFQLSDDTILLDLGIEIKHCYYRLIEFNNTSSHAVVTAEKIRNLPTKSINAIPAKKAGIFSSNEISVRGSREEETVYFLDGVRVTSGTKDVKTPEEKGQAGQVTAGEWNDLSNWEKWSDLLKQDEYRSMNKYWGIQTQYRYPVFATNEDNVPIMGISVLLKDHKDSIIWSTVTDIHGRAELFDLSEQPVSNLTLYYEHNNLKSKISLRKKNKDQGINIKIEAKCKSAAKANVAFVVDATGSMGDEINFLKSDLASVIGDIEARNGHVSISYSSVFYRDKGDTYVTKAQDFTSDKQQLISFIDKQSAGGGGDFPEAVDSALIHALDMSWEDDAEVKLIFLILDAHPHLHQIERYKKAVIKAAAMGIKIIPVTASGINRETDFLMKFTAILTNGTYAFITDHSGIGGDHLVPVHNDYEVEKLNELLIRLINGYLYSLPCEQIPGDHKNKVTIYPNPAKDVINIALTDENLKNIDVLSNTGQILVSSKETDKRNVRIDINDLISGQYFVRLTYEDKVITKSFIKMN